MGPMVIPILEKDNHEASKSVQYLTIDLEILIQNTAIKEGKIDDHLLNHTLKASEAWLVFLMAWLPVSKA